MTLSREQAQWAKEAIDREGLGDLAEVRHLDYRDVVETGFDAVSSIGLTEHIGVRNYPAYFAFLRDRLRPGGRLLNHSITRPHNQPPGDRRVHRPLRLPRRRADRLGRIITEAQNAGLEVQHEENLRRALRLTLAGWCRNLVENWDECVAEVGEGTARVWGLYMAGLAARVRAQRDPAAPGARARKTDDAGARRLPAAPDLVTRSTDSLGRVSTRAQQYDAQVLRREQLSAHLVRLVLGGPGLAGFASSTGIPDEWVGLVVPGQFQSRYYTVRSWAGGELTLDVVVHDVGPGHRVGGARLRRRHGDDHRAEGVVRDARRRRVAAAGRRPDRDAGDGPDRRDGHRPADPDLGRGARRPAPATSRRAPTSPGWRRPATAERAGRGRRGDRLARGRRATSGWRGSPRRCGRSAST